MLFKVISVVENLGVSDVSLCSEVISLGMFHVGQSFGGPVSHSGVQWSKIIIGA